MTHIKSCLSCESGRLAMKENRMSSKKFLIKILLFLSLKLIIVLLIPEFLKAQSPEPRGAFLRSLALPGWGHYYADNENWNRGKVHLSADILLMAGFAGSAFQEKNLYEKYH